jgi:hypothetical protein
MVLTALKAFVAAAAVAAGSVVLAVAAASARLEAAVAAVEAVQAWLPPSGLLALDPPRHHLHTPRSALDCLPQLHFPAAVMSLGLCLFLVLLISMLSLPPASSWKSSEHEYRHCRQRFHHPTAPQLHHTAD